MYDYLSLKKRLTENFAKKLFCTVDQLTAEQQVMIENQAWELAGIYAEMAARQERTEERAAQKLQPERTKRPRPAHHIIQAIPSRKTQHIGIDEVFEYETIKGKIYFSPLYPMKLIQTKIKCKIGHEGILIDDQPLKHSFDFPIHPSECWLGLEWPNGLFNTEGLTLFFDLLPEQLLHLVRIDCNGQSLTTKLGIPQPQKTIPRDYEEELWMQRVIEQPIVEKYQPHFLTFGKCHFEKDPKGSFPIEGSFEIDHPIAKEQLLWLHARFPFKVDREMLTGLAVNCFPALNRKLIHTEVKLGAEKTIIPLIDQSEPEGHLFPSYFLGLNRIHSVSQTFKAATTEHFAQAPVGTYRLIHGRGQGFDLMDAKTQVADFIRLLMEQREVMLEVFKLEHRNDLEGKVQNLARHLFELDAALATRRIVRPYHFVELKAMNRPEPVFVYYWVTQGEESLTNVSFDGSFSATNKSYNDTRIVSVQC